MVKACVILCSLHVHVAQHAQVCTFLELNSSTSWNLPLFPIVSVHFVPRPSFPTKPRIQMTIVLNARQLNKQIIQVVVFFLGKSCIPNGCYKIKDRRVISCNCSDARICKMKTCNWSEVFVDILLEHFLRISLHSWKYVWTLNWLWKYRYPSAKRRFLNPRHPSARNAVRSFLLTHIAYLLKWRKCIKRSGLSWDTCSSLDPQGHGKCVEHSAGLQGQPCCKAWVPQPPRLLGDLRTGPHWFPTQNPTQK